MTLCLSEKIVKIRKEHECFGCEIIIPKGSIAKASVNIDNTIYTLYFCHECNDFMKNHDSKDYSDDGEIGRGDIKEAIRQEKKYQEKR